MLRIPTRFAIGSNLGIALVSATTGLIGKLATAQVPFYIAIAVVAGALPGAQLGAWTGKHVKPKTLRYILAAIVSLAAILIGSDILF